MSRGLGIIQRQCLEVLQHNPGTPMDSIEITACVVCRDEVTDAEHASVRRALRKLAKVGSVVDMQRKGWRSNRRHWALPETAAGYYRDQARQFGIRAVPAHHRHLLQWSPPAEQPARIKTSRKASGTFHRGRALIRDPYLRQTLLGILTDQWQRAKLVVAMAARYLPPEVPIRSKAAGRGESYLVRVRLRGMIRAGLVEQRRGADGRKEYRLAKRRRAG